MELAERWWEEEAGCLGLGMGMGVSLRCKISQELTGYEFKLIVMHYP